MSRTAIAAVCLAAVSTAAHADEALYQRSVSLNTANSARLIVRAAEHPEVEVSRSLAAQPVHPWMAEVQEGLITTYIDPASNLSDLDENHTLRKAQRYFNSINGITTNDLAMMKNAANSAVNRIPMGNRAQVVVMPARPADQGVRTIRAIIPLHPQQPIPSVPKQTQPVERQVASK